MDENKTQSVEAPKEPTKKEKAQQAGKDVAELAAKGAATYFGGPAGGAIADKIAQTKAGQKVLNTAGKALSKNPVTKNALAKAQPAIEQAKPALNTAMGAMGGNPGGAASGAAANGANAAGNATNAASNASKAAGASQASNAGAGSDSLNPLSSKPNNNSNNSGFGNNKSGLFSNSDKTSSNDAMSASADFAKTMKKAKKIVGIVSAVAPIVLPIIFIVIIAVVIMAQIMTVRDFISDLAAQFTTGVEKLINFAQGDGWMTNEDSFFSYLDKEYKKFPSTTANNAQLDIPLIAATIHYSKTTDFEQYEENEGKEDSSYDSEDFEQLGSALTKDQTVSFYKVAKEKLGSVNSIWPGQKRLLGHVVQTKVTVEWVDVDAAGGYWANFFSYFGQTFASSVDDAYWNTPIKYVNPLTAIPAFLDLFNRAKAYSEMNGDALAGLKYDAINLAYEAQEFVYTFSELFKQSSRLESDESGSVVAKEDQNGFFKLPAPIIVRTMNYGFEEYKQMKEDMMEMRYLLSKIGIDSGNLTRKEVVKQAENSGDNKLKELAKRYKDNETGYMYSYTHYLQNVYVPFTYFYNEEYTLAEIDSVVEEIFDQRDFYNYLIGEDFNYSCGGSCIYPVGGQEIDNLKVRLLQCSDGNRGEPIPGEDLVDFEKYILGVVYAEIGPTAPAEAAKVQAIAARSFALTRAKQMGNAFGLKLEKEDGNWVLSIRNCTEDQVYCDPDKGCSNKYSSSSGKEFRTLYSGANTQPYTYKGPLAEDAPIRSAVSAVVGQVLLDASGNIVPTGYVNTNQNKWMEQANQGMDYTEIILAEYENGSRVSTSTCSRVCNAATGDYTQWKQLTSLGAPWGDIVIGNGKTINDIGCLVTSVSIQIARSGVPLTIPELNPGTFVEAIKPDGFQNGVLFVWSSTTKVAPTFVYQKSISLSGLTQSAKAQSVQSLINEGCYVIMEVKGGGGGEHYVAVDYVKGNDVYMMDPASTETVAWNKYPQHWTTNAYCYKVTG